MSARDEYARELESQTAAALFREEQRRAEDQRRAAVLHAVSRLTLTVPQLDHPTAASGYPQTVDEANERLSEDAPPEPRARLQFVTDRRGVRWCVEWRPRGDGTTWPELHELGPSALPHTPEGAEFLARFRSGRWYR